MRATKIIRHKVSQAMGPLFVKSSHPVPLDLLLWIPALLYSAWLTVRTASSIGYDRMAYELEVAVLLLAQTMVFFICAAFVDALLVVSAPRLCRAVYVGFVHLSLAALFIDSILYKLMSIHLARGIGFLCDGGISHIPTNWAQTGVSAEAFHKAIDYAFLVILTVAAYSWRMTRRSNRPVLLLSPGKIALVAAYCCMVALIAGSGENKDWLATLVELRSAMPVRLSSATPVFLKRCTVPGLRPLRGRDTIERAIQHASFKDGLHPDIFVFVLESFRSDFVNAEITPNLERYTAEWVKFPDSLSAANASHIAWYSFLMSNYGLYYGEEKRLASHAGSVPITLLRRMGYKINVLCSQTLDYYGIDKIAFGSDLGLCDSMYDAEKSSFSTPPERDEEVTKQLLQSIQGPSGGRLFLVFFASTHHDYNWPPREATPFTPFAQTWNYSDFRISKKQLALIMNRYRNSLHFQDRILGEIFSAMRRDGLYEKSIIAAFGDHGEEFLEHGKLLHASNLFRPQTHVPFFLKLPSPAAIPGSPIHRFTTATYLDLLPTLLDYLGVDVTNAYDGVSLFRKTNNQTVITAENGDLDPTQFCIQSEGYKAFFQYEFATRSTGDQRTLFLTRLTDTNDEAVNINLQSKAGETLLATNFDATFEALYPGTRLSANGDLR
jgi:membrane-anchored protein YejM (alkaline phosphatase superfamily)